MNLFDYIPISYLNPTMNVVGLIRFDHFLQPLKQQIKHIQNKVHNDKI